MTVQPAFQDWTAKAVEARVVEAAETLSLCPRSRGPKVFGSAMPEPVRSASEAYAPQAPRYRRRPTADAMDRMEQCWSWINALDDAGDRRLLYDWARARSGRGRSVKLLALEEGMSDRTMRREITRICSAIATGLNETRTPQPSTNTAQGAADDCAATATVPSHATHWRDDGARPPIDPAQPPVRTVSGRARRRTS